MSLFPSVRIEGGLFSPDLLDQIVSAGLPGQKPADFGLEPRRNMTDEIAAVFADARALWGVFQNRLDRLPDRSDPATTVTRDSWMIPFLGLLGFELRFNSKAYEADGLSFAVSHRAGEAEDSPPVHIVGARQELGRLAASGRPRLAPHSLLQEFLNRTDHVWGMVSNGRLLRLLRDSTYIRRQAYVEFDLEAIFEDERFLDFAALYRLIHRTRYPRAMADGADCLLEKYYAHSVEQGGRVRQHMRDGVEECILILANGFLAHPSNENLRAEIGSGRLTAAGLYKQLLKLVYRFIFLLVAEDRGLVSPDAVYREHYGVGRLRRLLEKRSSFSDHTDLWMGLRVLWTVFSDEKLASLLSLAPLNGELFAPLDLDSCLISNAPLLEGFWHLAKYRESPTSPDRRVNYSAIDVEEMGSVYESLLEFHPVIETDAAGRLRFELASGSERKITGSYYTPPELVNELIQSALVPVLGERLRGATSAAEKEKAILSLRVCDPACGSGHFLLAAARRLGKELARTRTGEDEPAPERVRECIRDVIAHCIYGVDKNPLAVDLCRVGLWIEGHTEGKPLTFLDHRIRCGDSLVGVFDLAVLKEGIPDEAFKPFEGDDKEAARAALRQNKFEKKDEPKLFGWDPRAGFGDFCAHCREVEAIADDSPEHVRRKKAAFEAQHRDRAWLRDKTACDLWTAAFFQKYVPGQPPITAGAVAEILAGGAVDGRLLGQASALAQSQAFFHWPLEFPEVFDRGGFDVVFGNPPWGQKAIEESEREKKLVLKKFSSLVGIFDLFRPFIELGIRMVLEHGAVGLILPDIVLMKDYESTRSFILNNLDITSIVWWPNPFTAVTMDAVSFSARREAPQDDNKVRICINRKADNAVSYFLDQGDFVLNPRHVFNIFLTAPKRKIIRHLDGYPTFGTYFEIHEGVHSGNMRKELFVKQAIDASCHKMFFGRGEIVPYSLSWGGLYICLSSAQNKKNASFYSNIGRENWHKREKILVRRTGDFVLSAVDYSGLYASNNFFLVFPKSEIGISLDGTCALLNSRFMTWFFRTIEPRQGRVFAELKIKHLEMFPLPRGPSDLDICSPLNELGKLRRDLTEDSLVSLNAKNKQELNAEIREVDSRIDNLVFSLFDLDEITKNTIREEVRHEN